MKNFTQISKTHTNILKSEVVQCCLPEGLPVSLKHLAYNFETFSLKLSNLKPKSLGKLAPKVLGKPSGKPSGKVLGKLASKFGTFSLKVMGGVVFLSRGGKGDNKHPILKDSVTLYAPPTLMGEVTISPDRAVKTNLQPKSLPVTLPKGLPVTLTKLLGKLLGKLASKLASKFESCSL